MMLETSTRTHQSMATAGTSPPPSDGDIGWIDPTTTLLVTSLAVNVCALLVLLSGRLARLASLDVFRWRQLHSQRSTKSFSTSYASSRGVKLATTDAVNRRRIVARTLVEVLLACACCAAGLYICTLPAVWTSPFSGDNPSTGITTPSILVAAALGRFLFDLADQLLGHRRRRVTATVGSSQLAWGLFRGVYTTANVACLTAILATRQNLIVAGFILILELDTGVEEATRALDDSRRRRPFVDGFITVVKLVLVFARLVLPATLVAIGAGSQSPVQLGPCSTAVVSFSVVFYTTMGAFLLWHQLVRVMRRRREAVQQRKQCGDDVEIGGGAVVKFVRPQALPAAGLVIADGKRRKTDASRNIIGTGRRCRRTVGWRIVPSEHVLKAMLQSATTARRAVISFRNNSQRIAAVSSATSKSCDPHKMARPNAS